MLSLNFLRRAWFQANLCAKQRISIECLESNSWLMALISWFGGQIESKTTKLQLCQGCLPQGRFRAPDIITTGRNYLLDCDYSVDFLYFLLSCEKCSRSLNLRSASTSAFTHLDVRADCNNERLFKQRWHGQLTEKRKSTNDTWRTRRW